MRQQKNPACAAGCGLFQIALFAACFLAMPPAAGAGEADELSAPANYDEVVRDLIRNLSKDNVTAQDAAQKLSRLGRRSVGVLAEVFAASFVPPPEKKEDGTAPVLAKKGDPQLAYYSAWALSRIKLADAARPLLPILKSEAVSPDLKVLAIESLGLELVEEGGDLLQKVAAEDPDLEMRKKALSQLMIMPNFWIKSEKLFVTALSDPDEDIRTLAAKQCMYARVYLTATDKLIEMSENEPGSLARTNVMLALSRMRVRKAVPALVRTAVNPETPDGMLKLALRTLNAITGVSLKDGPAVETWWKKFGAQEYAKLEALPDAPAPAGPGSSAEKSAAP